MKKCERFLGKYSHEIKKWDLGETRENKVCVTFSTPEGLEDVSKYPDLLAALLEDPTWSEEDVQKVAGLNLLRVFAQVEEVRERQILEMFHVGRNIPILFKPNTFDIKSFILKFADGAAPASLFELYSFCNCQTRFVLFQVKEKWRLAAVRPVEELIPGVYLEGRTDCMYLDS